jgi:hypothetical protein
VSAFSDAGTATPAGAAADDAESLELQPSAPLYCIKVQQRQGTGYAFLFYFSFYHLMWAQVLPALGRGVSFSFYLLFII